MERFEGFADADAKFFKALAKNQKREWFQAHKDEFEQGWNEPMKLLAAEVRAAIDRAYPRCDLAEPKVFRIFRDVRFSKDKTPYKTHISCVFPVKRAGEVQSVPAALYVQFGTETFAGAGQYMMDGPSLARFRDAIVDDRGKELVKILARLDKKGFKADLHERYKRVPKGFDPEHPRADLLMRKGLMVEFPKMPKGLLASKKLAAWLADGAKQAAPLVEWLVFATA